MICNNCNNNVAIYHTLDRDNDKVIEKHLCKNCVEKKGLSKNLEYFNNPIITDNCCKTCGRLWDEFLKTGLLGCSDCYINFKEELKPVINKLQGSLIHYGKEKTQELTAEEKEYMELNKQLKTAVYNEEYELASQIQQKMLSFRDVNGNK